MALLLCVISEGIPILPSLPTLLTSALAIAVAGESPSGVP